MVRLTICNVLCKICFSIFRNVYGWNNFFESGHRYYLSRGSLHFHFRSILFFRFFHFSSFHFITCFLSFQKPPRGKPRLIWVICGVLWGYQPKHIQNFREIFTSCRQCPANIVTGGKARRVRDSKNRIKIKKWSYSSKTFTNIDEDVERSSKRNIL